MCEIPMTLPVKGSLSVSRLVSCQQICEKKFFTQAVDNFRIRHPRAVPARWQRPTMDDDWGKFGEDYLS